VIHRLGGYTNDDSHENDLIMTNCCEILNLYISKSGETNEDDSYLNDLNLDRDRGADAAIQCDTFKNDSEVAPPSCTIFSDDGADVDGPRFSPFSLVGSGSRLAIYFQNVNRLQTKTTDLFKAVLEDDYDVIVLLETSSVSSFHDKELFDARYFVFRCGCSLSTSTKKFGRGRLGCGETNFK
jgi:hypothetical protein